MFGHFAYGAISTRRKSLLVPAAYDLGAVLAKEVDNHGYAVAYASRTPRAESDCSMTTKERYMATCRIPALLARTPLRPGHHVI